MGTKSTVDEYNINRLSQIQGREYILTAVDQYPQHIRKQDIDKVLARSRSETGGLDYTISIKEGCRVMLTTNIDIADRLINGQMGTVVKISLNEQTEKPNILYIKFDDSEAGRNAISKHTNRFAQENNAVPIGPFLARIKVRPGKPSSLEVQRTQFPITLAYACTVHKVQGLTLNKVVVSFDLIKQRSFNYGQIYVALSRATSLQGLNILGNIESKHIKANPKVEEEYERLRKVSSIINNPQPAPIENDGITVSLLNIRSLNKHSIDVKHDQNMMTSDIMVFTETQMLPQTPDNDTRQYLHPFDLIRQDHPTDKYMSLALCTKKHIKVTSYEYFPSVNGLNLKYKATLKCKNNLFF